MTSREEVLRYAVNHGWSEYASVRPDCLLVKHSLKAGGFRSVFVYFTDDGRVEYASSQTTYTKAVVIPWNRVTDHLRDYGA